MCNISREEMPREVFVKAVVDDMKAIDENIGTIEYLEREFGWLKESGIHLKEAFLAEEDSDNDKERYTNYLINFAFKCASCEYNTLTAPLSFKEFLDSEKLTK